MSTPNARPRLCRWDAPSTRRLTRVERRFFRIDRPVEVDQSRFCRRHGCLDLIKAQLLCLGERTLATENDVDAGQQHVSRHIDLPT